MRIQNLFLFRILTVTKETKESRDVEEQKRQGIARRTSVPSNISICQCWIYGGFVEGNPPAPKLIKPFGAAPRNVSEFLVGECIVHQCSPVGE